MVPGIYTWRSLCGHAILIGWPPSGSAGSGRLWKKLLRHRSMKIKGLAPNDRSQIFYMTVESSLSARTKDEGFCYG